MTPTIHASEVADMGLAGHGEGLCDWSAQSMPILARLRERYAAEQPFAGRRIAIAVHITTETANLALTLQAGGAEVFLCASNVRTTNDAVAAYAARQGVHVHGIQGEDRETYAAHCHRVLDARPHLVIDDGADLTGLLHGARTDAASDVVAGLEETTAGIQRIRSLEADGLLRYPVVAVNEARTKHLFDNRYGTGQSTMDAVLRLTNTLVAGARVVVAGYGMCGKGVAARARGMGADVLVTEVDHVRALEAVMDGYRVMEMDRAAELGDLFITVTSSKNVLRAEHFALMPDGAIVCNSGHFDVEIDVPALRAAARKHTRPRPGVDQYTLANGRRITLLAGGEVVNLAAAEGNPATLMDMSFANQVLGCEYLLRNAARMDRRVHALPADIDDHVADLKLRTLGVGIDTLSEEQIAYLRSWDQGSA
ncbi:adenosylhomocysteinase [Streptomyces angustmyceticus]|uniref:adenosylhomocysteinase n=1 Tax=Streptomyces angustmyceticus TaxID=285578 RepID=UPI003D911943